MDRKMLKHKKNNRCLGLLMDHKLTWENHIKELNTKLVKYTGIFSKIRRCLSLSCRRTVHNVFISSRLNYGSDIYTNTTKNFTQPPIVTQNKIPLILQFRNIKTTINNIYREFGVLKLTDMHDFNICCIVHKFMLSPTFASRSNQLYILPKRTNSPLQYQKQK